MELSGVPVCGSVFTFLFVRRLFLERAVREVLMGVG